MFSRSIGYKFERLDRREREKEINNDKDIFSTILCHGHNNKASVLLYPWTIFRAAALGRSNGVIPRPPTPSVSITIEMGLPIKAKSGVLGGGIVEGLGWNGWTGTIHNGCTKDQSKYIIVDVIEPWRLLIKVEKNHVMLNEDLLVLNQS